MGIESYDTKKGFLNLKPLPLSTIVAGLRDKFSGVPSPINLPEFPSVQEWILIKSGVPRKRAFKMATEDKDLLVTRILGFNNPFYSVAIRHLNHTFTGKPIDINLLTNVLVSPQRVLGKLGPTFTEIVLDYTPNQWIKVQESCWSVKWDEIQSALGKREIEDYEQEGYFKKNSLFMNFDDFSDYQHSLAIIAAAEETAFLVQKLEGVSRITTVENSLVKFLRLNNLTRGSLAKRTSIVFSAALAELKDSRRPSFLKAFIDNETEEPLTINTLEGKRSKLLFPQNLS